MKRKLPEKFFEQNQRAKTRKWKFFNLNQALWGAGNREFRNLGVPAFVLPFWERSTYIVPLTLSFSFMAPDRIESHYQQAQQNAE